MLNKQTNIVGFLRAPRNYWFGAKLQDKLLWNWTDGTPLQLSEISLPIFGLGNFSCAVLSQKGVQTVECTTYQNAICKRPSEPLLLLHHCQQGSPKSTCQQLLG